MYIISLCTVLFGCIHLLSVKSMSLTKKLIKMGFWNIEGLNIHSEDSKLNDLDFVNVVKQHDIFALSETHIGEKDVVSIDGYGCMKICRPLNKQVNRYFGGLVILYKTDLKPGIKFLEHKNNDYIWAQISREYFGLDEDLFICFTYIPPENSSYFKTRNQDTLTFIENDIVKYSTLGKICLVGDFNARTNTQKDFISNDSGRDIETIHYNPDLNLLSRVSADKVATCTRGKRLLDLCISARLRIVNGRCVGDSRGQFTCHKYGGSSVIDYLIISEESFKRILYFKVNTFAGQLSDHCSITWAFKCHLVNSDKLQAKSKCQVNMPETFKWDKMSITKFQMAFVGYDIRKNIDSFLYPDTNTDVNLAASQLAGIYIQAANKSLHKKLKRPRNHRYKNKKWYDCELKEMKRDLLLASKLLHRYPNLPETRRGFYVRLKTYKKLKKLKIRKFKEKTLSKLDSLREYDPQAYWKLLDSLKESKQSNHIPSEEWEMYFRKLNTPSTIVSEEFKQKLMDLEKLKIFNKLDFRISNIEITQAIKSLKMNKSVGFDAVSNEMLRYSQHIMTPLLNKLFNMILSQGKYPAVWCKGYIIPIFKNGDPLMPSNYRGIAILSALSKLFNRILNDRLSKFICDNNLIDQKQIGFRKGSRTSDHMFMLKTLIDVYTRNNGKLFTCFVDFKKAFDSINHQFLLYKLLKAGIGGNFYNVIKDMYVNTGTKLAVRVDDTLTPFFNSYVGVRQGDVLSPTLFNLFINDVIACLDEACDTPKLGSLNISCLLYADDLVLISQSEKGLQQAVTSLEKYCETWGLAINPDKTKIVVFNKKDILIDTNVKFGKLKIQSVESYKYLGILFAKNGNLAVAKIDLMNRGQKAMFKLNSCFKSSQPGFNTSIHLFDHVVKPVMMYASEIWGGERFASCKSIYNLLVQDTMEKCHLKHLRYSLGVSKKAPKLAVYGETGRFPLLVEAISNTVKYYIRLCSFSVNENELLVNALHECQRLNLKKPWLHNVKDILKKSGISLSSAHLMNPLLITKRVKAYLQAEFIKGWKSELENDKRSKGHGNKLRTYRSFKTTFSKEYYLEDCIVTKHRQALSRLRMGAHKLQIEVDRYTTKNRIPPEQRICKICNLGICEDEFHLVMVCPKYHNLRQIMFNNVLEKFPCFQSLDIETKFFCLMANADECVIQWLGSFVYSCFIMRNSQQVQQ